MQPLGQFPSQRVKLRVKQYEPPKRYVQTRLMQGLSREGAGKKGPGRRRRSESRHDEPTTPNAETSASTAAVKSESGQALGLRETSTPVLPEPPLHITPAPATRLSLQPFAHPTTSSTYTGNAPYESLRDTIDAALARSIEKKQRTRGLAIKKLYEEGFTNPNLAELLDAILSQKASEAQQHQFQTYIKLARKEFKAEKNHSRRSSTTIGGANVIVESIENSPVSRLLATASSPTHSSRLTSFDPHHASLDLSSLHHPTAIDLPSLHHPTSFNHHAFSNTHTFHHYQPFPDKDTPLASLEGGVPLSPTLPESHTNIMPPKKRLAEPTEVVSAKRAKLQHNGDMPKPTVSKPNTKKRSAPKDDEAPTEESSVKRAKRDTSTTSQESALTEMDSDGLKDLEAVATKEVSPRLSVDAPFAKSSNLLPYNQKNAESFLAPPERRRSTPTYVTTKETRELNAKENGRPTRTRIPSKKAIEAAEVHRMNLPVFPKDNLTHEEVAKMKKTFVREHPDYKFAPSDIRTPTVDHSGQASPALIAPALALPTIIEQETNGPPSPTSSDAGDFLVPPPPGAQRVSNRPSRVQTPRAASPVKTTRTTRNGNKGARVKYSYVAHSHCLDAHLPCILRGPSHHRNVMIFMMMLPRWVD